MKAVRLFKTTCRGKKAGRRGVLTFEWILIFTLLVIGIVGGLSAARDATVAEFGGVSEAMISLDPGYHVSGVSFKVHDPTQPNNPNAMIDISAPGMFFRYPLPITSTTPSAGPMAKFKDGRPEEDEKPYLQDYFPVPHSGKIGIPH